MPVTRRAALLGGAGLVAGAAAGAAGMAALGPQAPSRDGVDLIVPAAGEGVLNDASLLSPTPVHRHIVLRDDPGEAMLAALRAEIRDAAANGRPVCLSAARHSMGGQSLPRDGHAITFDNGMVEVGRGIYRAHAGARWNQVIAALDPAGLSPKVMQSNADFGIGSTFSVNAHGWPVAFGPMGSTVRHVKILLADGSHVTASPTQEAEIFAAAMGGYGLIGLITEMDVEAVPNALLDPSFEPMPAADLAARFAAVAKTVPMAYGRLNIDRARFFQDAMLVSFRPVEGPIPPVTGSGWLSRRARDVFRLQVDNEWVKRRRWGVETGVGAWLAGPASRSSLMFEPVLTLDDRDDTRTDILHEYFVAPDRFADFLEACRAVIPGSFQEMLNVTLRWVERDPVSLLSYAPDGPRIAAVMIFSQEMSARGEADMAWMTRRLIGAVQGIGGSYYLPYRLHASRAQFREGYRGAEAFAAFKRAVDPGLVFRNALWDTYLADA